MMRDQGSGPEGGAEGEEEIPPQFLDFAGRHGLIGFYTPWVMLLVLCCYPILIAVMSIGSPKDRDLMWGGGVLGLLMWAGSLVAFRRKRRADAARMAAYRRWRELGDTPSSGWDSIWRFDGRVAEVRGDRGAVGYLYVAVGGPAGSDGRRAPTVELSVALVDAAEPGQWRFGDRAYPDADEVREELRTGIVSWFGEHLLVDRWLAGAQAARAIGAHFGQPPAAPSDPPAPN
ncbi:hypothetical protein [Micromonospora eburnea]|uniref:Uncharacterized protein n=1 Tax=Micromonospora eburnea TaxID=227316 RepID=A0A1C6VAQ2_9ACTN|nr:hypothetical protein [Micromonospora eburnea]SCL63345.1 hypothetical protein GA0070604_4953 [Micromonospora eburnea]